MHRAVTDGVDFEGNGRIQLWFCWPADAGVYTGIVMRPDHSAVSDCFREVGVPFAKEGIASFFAAVTGCRPMPSARSFATSCLPEPC